MTARGGPGARGGTGSEDRSASWHATAEELRDWGAAVEARGSCVTKSMTSPLASGYGPAGPHFSAAGCLHMVYVLFYTYGEKHNSTVSHCLAVRDCQRPEHRQGARLSSQHARHVLEPTTAITNGGQATRNVAPRPRPEVCPVRRAVGIGSR